MFPIFISYFPIVSAPPGKLYRFSSPNGEVSEPYYAQQPEPKPKYTPEQVLYQPMAMFPVQMLPYQYYQIIRGKYLYPSAYFLAYFFTPEFIFAEPAYMESIYMEPAFQEKGEYAT